MIKIQKPTAPQVLQDNKATWTQNLLDAINTYGGYSKIPESDKNSLLSHYRHKNIQAALFSSSHHKCAFCECIPGESSHMEVEHFEPKSLYPDLAFDWDNFLPSCRICNEEKSDTDTRTNPIINPAIEDPEQLLTYSFLRIKPLAGSGQEQKAQQTIDVCNLNCERLYNARSALMKSITEYIDELKDKINWISEADTDQKRKVRITKLKNSIAVIDSLTTADSAFSGYAKWFIQQCPEYQEAKRIVTSR